MNWRRIVKYAVIIFAVMTAYGIFLGMWLFPYYQSNPQKNHFIMELNHSFTFLLTAGLFYLFARKVDVKPFIQALITWCIVEVVAKGALFIISNDLLSIDSLLLSVTSILAMYLGVALAEIPRKSVKK